MCYDYFFHIFQYFPLYFSNSLVILIPHEDGEKVQEFTGNESGNNARVALLNKDGVILYFYDRGFSVGALNELRNALEATR